MQVTLIVPRASAVPALAAVMGFEGKQRYIRGADELSARRRRRTRKGQDCNSYRFIGAPPKIVTEFSVGSLATHMREPTRTTSTVSFDRSR